MPLHVSTRLDEAAVTYKIVSLDRNNNIKFNDQELGSHVSLREIGGLFVCLLHTAKCLLHTAKSDKHTVKGLLCVQVALGKFF